MLTAKDAKSIADSSNIDVSEILDELCNYDILRAAEESHYSYKFPIPNNFSKSHRVKLIEELKNLGYRVTIDEFHPLGRQLVISWE